MTWLLITILAYFLLAVSTLGDKFLLKEKIPSPELYSFLVGIFGIFVLLLSPFGFFFPNKEQIILAFLTGAIFIAAFFLYTSAAKDFEVSRVAPAIGGLTPIFIFIIVALLYPGKEIFSFKEIFALSFLILGSVFIILEKITDIFGKSFFLAALAAFYFALYFTLAKFVYLSLGFINGLIWIRLGSFLAGLFFLLSKKVRASIFIGRELVQKGGKAFLWVQIIGSLGNILQNFAISLVKLSAVSLITALQGVQYLFLFIFSLILSKKFPQILKEEISRKIILQKTAAIFLIVSALAVLALS